MLFTNVRSIKRTEMNFTNPNVEQIRPVPIRPNIKVVTSSTIVQNLEVAQEKKKKIKWGEPFWNLFHVLAEKVNEETFPEIRDSLLQLIYTICVNLPCPDCAKHATNYLNTIRYDMIQTKMQLKDMLFQFHNSVNKRRQVEMFPREQLDEKYSRGLLGPIINEFLTHFQQKHKSIRMISDDFYRAKIGSRLVVWFQENMRYFI
jgi:hypothetical protein